MRTVLFLCSGNSCRSRYAEYLFNQLAETQQLKWRAISRGLMVDWSNSPIAISAETIQTLSTNNINIPNEFTQPQQVAQADFELAHLLIAVNETEHRPVFQARFPEWEDEIEYWSIQDSVLASSGQGLPQLTTMVELLIEDLSDVPVMAY